MAPDTIVAAVAANTNWTGNSKRDSFSVGSHLEEPSGVLVIVQLVVEELRASTENVATIAISQAPSNGPERELQNENVDNYTLSTDQ